MSAIACFQKLLRNPSGKRRKAALKAASYS